MGTLKTWRKAYGALKDSTKVGLAHVNSDYADLDVAIVKATNHVECPPKDRHLRKVLIATGAVRPRADVAYCIHALARRLAKTHNWTVALKTLIVIHRILREGDPTFREELLNFSQRGRVLQLSNFKDDSSPIAWDCSAWVRTYALFLEERLECFKTVKYDIEAERLPRPVQGQDKGYSRTRDLESEELLEQLPALQNLLYRLMGCRPEGAAVGNFLIQYALALVLKESFKVYCAINDGIINLVDKFFEMPRHEAVKALEVYKRAGQQAGNLSDFYEVCKGLELARNFQFPLLREPPQSFIATMEEYISEAPRVVSVPTEPMLQLTYIPENPDEEEDSNVPADDHEPLPSDSVATTDADEAAASTTAAPPPTQINNLDTTGDLLGLNDDAVDPFSQEEKNALALAIVTTEADATATAFGSGASHMVTEFDPSGWELALVTTPSTNISSAATERQLAGGLDTLTLNSLYDEGVYRGASQQAVYGAAAPNPFAVQDPFSVSNSIAPLSAVPMDAMAHHHHHHHQQQQQQQTNPFGAFPQQPPVMMFPQPPPPPVYSTPQPLMITGGTSNPFGETTEFGAFPLPPTHGGVVPLPVQQQNTNPFGSSGLL